MSKEKDGLNAIKNILDNISISNMNFLPELFYWRAGNDAIVQCMELLISHGENVNQLSSYLGFWGDPERIRGTILDNINYMIANSRFEFRRDIPRFQLIKNVLRHHKARTLWEITGCDPIRGGNIWI
jgi:hypothetical protein